MNKLSVSPNMLVPGQNRPDGGDFFKLRAATVTLADGVSFSGTAPDWQTGSYRGEVVFNTGMTGYVESLTDPSYSGQILVFTYPLIGNYGVSQDGWEGEKIYAAGVVVSEACQSYSHAGATMSFLAWLKSQGVPVLVGADTRAITKHLRGVGTMAGVLHWPDQTPTDFTLSTQQVSIPKPIIYSPTKTVTVIVVDCGMKHNILRSLLALGVRVKRVPLDYDYSGEDFDGVVISNGPGDPTDYLDTIRIAAAAMTKGKPVFGICLGSQIMALAAGAKTYKLPFGHRGHNQPAEAADGHCYITSQNHGYAIDETSLPSDWEVTFRNLNDGSVEGIAHRHKPFFSVQFHPEACPGPTDTAWLFDKFYRSL